MGHFERVVEGYGRVGGEVEQLCSEPIDEIEEQVCKGWEEEGGEEGEEKGKQSYPDKEGEKEIVEEGEEGELVKVVEEEGKHGCIDCEGEAESLSKKGGVLGDESGF